MNKGMRDPGPHPDVKLDRGTRIRVIARLGKYIWEHKVLALTAFFLMLATNLLALAGPKISGGAIGAIEAGGPDMIRNVLGKCVILALLYAGAALFSYLLAVTMIKLSQKVVYRMRKQVFDHLLELPVGYFDTHQTGDTISHISYDIDTVNASLSQDLLQICTSVITVVGSLIMMLTISPPLVLVFAVTVPVSLLLTKYRSGVVRPLFRERSRKLGELNGYAEEMLSGQSTIRVYGRERVFTERFDRRNSDAVTAYYRADYQGSVIGPSVNYINNISISLITIFGGIMYMLTNREGFTILPIFAIGLEGIASFVQYSRKFAGPISEFANIISELQSACAAAERVFRLIDEKPEPDDRPDARSPEEIHGAVDFHDVCFGYTPEKRIIYDLNLSVKPGSTVAIVGPTGAGKTTVINLLMRFYDIDSGTITLDGTEQRDLRRDRLRSAYTMVLQDTWLFHGTVADNILYAGDGLMREDAERAARAAHIHAFIESLPEGYDTVISDDGVNISKGQKQLITIARAMLPKTSMLILDEATSNVDSRTEIAIRDAMEQLTCGRTCFIIAHRLSTVKNADIILVINDGRIVERGTHDELLAARGQYYGLYNAQSEQS